jgi:hypothetical protein
MENEPNALRIPRAAQRRNAATGIASWMTERSDAGS